MCGTWIVGPWDLTCGCHLRFGVNMVDPGHEPQSLGTGLQTQVMWARWLLGQARSLEPQEPVWHWGETRIQVHGSHSGAKMVWSRILESQNGNLGLLNSS